MSKVGRNAPCPCGSGKKFKKCCLTSEGSSGTSGWRAEQMIRAAFSKKKCSVPDELRAGCGGKRIRAHTISKSGSLNRIARDGHLYAYQPNFTKLGAGGGMTTPESIGVNRASTFFGFCAAHDRDLFLPLDDAEFTPTAEQMFLLAYRAFAREVYTKDALLESLPIYDTLGVRNTAPQWTKDLIDGAKAGTEAATRENQRRKQALDRILISGAHGELRNLVIELEEPPPIMCSGGFNPIQTAHGFVLQDLGNLSVEPDLMMISSFADARAGYVVLSWLPASDGCCQAFAQSLDSLDWPALGSCIVRIMFEYIENLFISPNWWDGLAKGQKNSLNQRMWGIREEMIGAHQNGDIRDDGMAFGGIEVKGVSRHWL